MKKSVSLSDKIAGLLSTAPKNFDPEDDICEETVARVTETELADENYEDVKQRSNYRKQNVDLLDDVDKRYAGKVKSRKSLRDPEEQWESESEGLLTDEGEALDGIDGTRQFVSGSENDDDEEESDDEEMEEEKNSEESENDENKQFEDSDAEGDDEDVKFKTMSSVNVSNQVKKGSGVRNQLNIWESLLEMRIQLQKCLVASNKLPQYDVIREFSNESFVSEVLKTRNNIRNVLDKFLTLQELVLGRYPETKSLLKDSKAKLKEKVDSDEEILSDSDAEIKSDSEAEVEESRTPKKRKKLSDFEEEIKLRHNKYSDYRNSVIQKWNEKIRITANQKNAGSQSLIQHINFLLEDKQRLIKRTQLKRSEYEILGKKSKTTTQVDDEQNQSSKLSDEYDTEIFDDDDFYHQLLRELIEFKSAGITDPIQMSRQWIQLQNLRSKMKRKVDTRATKGRKIRYAVHSKLVNFMAPIDNNSWTDEAKNELFSSLFGNKSIT